MKCFPCVFEKDDMLWPELDHLYDADLKRKRPKLKNVPFFNQN